MVCKALAVADFQHSSIGSFVKDTLSITSSLKTFSFSHTRQQAEEALDILGHKTRTKNVCVCVCVCMFMYVYVYVYVYLYSFMFMYVCMFMYVYVYVYVCLCVIPTNNMLPHNTF